MNCVSKLCGRSLLSITGNDSSKFLQGLITNHMPRIERGGDGFYACFLSAQGRVLYDAFIYPRNLKDGSFTRQEYIIDCDSEIRDDLAVHMAKYVLRKKVNIANFDSHNVYQIWGPDVILFHGASLIETAKSLPTGSLVSKQKVLEIGMLDPRHPDLGLRIVSDSEPTLDASIKLSSVLNDEYILRRMLLGIPEGVNDIFVNSSLPLESNMDYMHAVDFRKGCYLGQELTIRTFHNGVTRKRIMPIQIYDDTNDFIEGLDRNAQFNLPASQAEIKIEGFSGKVGIAGKFCSGMHNVGLALLRLEAVERKDAMVLRTESGLKIKAIIPKWWPLLPK